MLRRNLGRISTITADKGYDWADLRMMLRAHGVRPVIKHREFDSLDKAHNARLDDEVYHRRSVVETVFRVLKQRFGDRLTSRTWYAQFRELVLRIAAKNLEDHVQAVG
jgi:IS5 family transposase